MQALVQMKADSPAACCCWGCQHPGVPVMLHCADSASDRLFNVLRVAPGHTRYLADALASSSDVLRTACRAANFNYGGGNPMRPHRVRLTHSLVKNYGLNKRLLVHRPQPRNDDELEMFHADGACKDV